MTEESIEDHHKVLGQALIPGAVARVNMPAPGRPGMRIVGYRVPTEDAPLVDILTFLQELEQEVAAMRASLAS